MIDFLNSLVDRVFNDTSAEEGIFIKLPDDLSLKILNSLSVKDLSRLSLTCRHFRQLSKHETLPIISLSYALFAAVLRLPTSCSAGSDGGDICRHYGKVPHVEFFTKESLIASAGDRKDADVITWKMHDEMSVFRWIDSRRDSFSHFCILRGLEEKKLWADRFTFVPDNHYEVKRATIDFYVEMHPRLKLSLKAAIEEFNALCARRS